MIAIVAVLLMAAAPLAGMSPTDVTAFQTSQKKDDFAARLKSFVQKTLGTPYHDGPLGEGPGAKYDADPLIDLTRVDCVTFVEQSIALTISPDYDTTVRNLQHIRYKGGRVDYGARNHFLISDWVANNAWCKDISETLGVKTEPITRTISRKAFFEKQGAPELGEGIADQQQTVNVIPLAGAAVAEAHLPDTALLIFVGKIDWLFALHCGFYLRDAQGVGTLYHASSKEGQVVGVPLLEYLKANEKRYRGFTAYTLSPSLSRPLGP